MEHPPLVCIMGPTAAGKTDLAIALAQQFGGELVSVDSALVYRGLDIGAAKPDFPHHLVDIRDPSEPYSAADFRRDAAAVIADVRARGKLPILVGGTVLYFRALLQGLDDIPATDPVIRQTLEREAQTRGWPALHAELAAVDPELAARLHPNHSQRIGRGLEVFRMTGRPLSEFQQGGVGSAVAGPILALAVCPEERSILHQRIEQRFDHMLDAGFVDEVRRLYDRGDLHPDLPAVRAVGYRQLWSFLADEVDLETARSQGIAATRQLAKRQLTWLRRWPDLIWLLTDATGRLTAIEAGSPVAGSAVNWAALQATLKQRGITSALLPEDKGLAGFLSKILGNPVDFPRS